MFTIWLHKFNSVGLMLCWSCDQRLHQFISVGLYCSWYDLFYIYIYFPRFCAPLLIVSSALVWWARGGLANTCWVGTGLARGRDRLWLTVAADWNVWTSWWWLVVLSGQHSPQWHWDPPTPARHLSSEAYQVQAGTARWWGEPVITSCVSSASSAVWLSQFTRGLWWVRSDVLSCDGKKDVSLQSEDTVWVGASPALQFLLRCGLVERRNSGLSTDDIYNKKILHRGVQKLQVSPRPHLPRRHSNWNDISERFPRNWWDYHRPGSLIIKSWKSFTRESASGGNRSWD